MILTLGLSIILFILIVANGVLIIEQEKRNDWQDKRIKELAEQNDWQDLELKRLRERIYTLEKRLQEMEELTNEQSETN